MGQRIIHATKCDALLSVTCAIHRAGAQAVEAAMQGRFNINSAVDMPRAFSDDDDKVRMLVDLVVRKGARVTKPEVDKLILEADELMEKQRREMQERHR